MNVMLTVEVEFFYPDNPLVISSNWCRAQFSDVVPSMERFRAYLDGWFSDEIETDLSMVRVWCDRVVQPTVFLPRTVWNSVPRLIVGAGVPEAMIRSIRGSFLQ